MLYGRELEREAGICGGGNSPWPSAIPAAFASRVRVLCSDPIEPSLDQWSDVFEFVERWRVEGVGGLCRGRPSLLVCLLKPRDRLSSGPGCKEATGIFEGGGDSGRVKRRDAGGRLDRDIILLRSWKPRLPV